MGRDNVRITRGSVYVCVCVCVESIEFEHTENSHRASNNGMASVRVLTNIFLYNALLTPRFAVIVVLCINCVCVLIVSDFQDSTNIRIVVLIQEKVFTFRIRHSQGRDIWSSVQTRFKSSYGTMQSTCNSERQRQLSAIDCGEAPNPVRCTKELPQKKTQRGRGD